MANDFSWLLSDEDKATLRARRVTFVMAPREMSDTRLHELVKETMSKGSVVFGVAEEPFVLGFEEQPQFRMLPAEKVKAVAEKISKAGLAEKFAVLAYPQAEVDDIVRALRPKTVIVVRGSYKYPFHRSSTCALLERRGISFTYVSPFVDEKEAEKYLSEVSLPTFTVIPNGGSTKIVTAVLRHMDEIARKSFDYSFQTGAVLAEQIGDDKYKIYLAACNEVVPYQTYALHYGNAREVHRSEHQGDASHYDTIHAEMNLLVRAMKNGVNFAGKSLFINMMPCPNCARTLAKTGLKEVVYHYVHSDGYAKDLLEKANIKVRRIYE